ncbi:MAG: hypothetical protein HC896_12385 [Bacteroidales bacterium]|nr:hypothetical protein [Bacteroidales bacterium]
MKQLIYISLAILFLASCEYFCEDCSECQTCLECADTCSHVFVGVWEATDDCNEGSKVTINIPESDNCNNFKIYNLFGDGQIINIEARANSFEIAPQNYSPDDFHNYIITGSGSVKNDSAMTIILKKDHDTFDSYDETCIVTAIRQ